MLAFELFFGALDPLAEFVELASEAAPAAHERLRRRIREQATRRRNHDGEHVPSPVCDLVTGLLEMDPRSRWNAHRASSFLEETWSEITGVWRSERDERPLLVAFMPNESEATLYQQRRWLTISPREPAGRDGLLGWFERELRHAEIVHSPRGATGYAKHRSKEALEQAEWVLIGERAVWFCAYLRTDQIEDRALVIKFIRERDRAAELLRLRPRRRIDRLALFAWEPGQSAEHRLEGHPSWRPLLGQVRQRRSGNAEDLAFLDAMDFFLEYQQTELDAREYVVSVVPAELPLAPIFHADLLADR